MVKDNGTRPCSSATGEASITPSGLSQRTSTVLAPEVALRKPLTFGVNHVTGAASV